MGDDLPHIPESERTPLVEALLEIIRVLKADKAKLEERVARLEKNSSNSSKPPSSDITKRKEEQRQPGKRKIGGQPGHKGSFRREFLPAEIDRRKKLKLLQCPDCCTPLKQTDDVIVHQQAELVSKPVIVTEYQLQGGHCACCNKLVYPELPAGVIPNQLLGPRLLTLSGYMKASMGVSVSEVQEFFKDVLGVKVCRGMVQKAIFRVSDAIAPAYEQLLQAVVGQKALNIDETGWKENGKKQWVWLFCNKLMALFVISNSRGCKVLSKVLGENFLGALTSDFYSAYTKYASPKQQFCLAHLIRELKFLTTLPDPKNKQFGNRLLAYMRRLFKLWHSRESLSDEQWKKKSLRFKRDLQRYLFAHPFERGTDAYRIHRRLVKHWNSLFRFLEQPDIYEPTNNLAERTLRPLVRLRRISQGSRGNTGSLWTQRAASVLATCKLQHKNVWDFFLSAVNSHHFNSLAHSFQIMP